MRTCGVQFFSSRVFVAAAVALTGLVQPGSAQNKPTGAPLVLSSVETEQEVPLAFLTPDVKGAAKCAPIRIHWIAKTDVTPADDATSFAIDLPAENPAAAIFTAQLWNASLASALAWQQPWEGARWKILQTPVTDGTGIDAALAVGMIATSARRPYPPKTVVIGSLNPDASLGPVSHLVERVDAAAKAGMTRVIIPSVQRFETDESGQVINVVRHASDLHLECIPVDDLVTATQTTMNDPLPDTASLDTSIPKYANEVSSYIDDYATHEQNEATQGLKFAPKETDLAQYPPRIAAIWKSIYADYDAGQQAYGAGQVYVAYQLFTRANGRMNGANALAGQTRASFDVKSALAESEDLHDHLHILMNPPSIDNGKLESALVVAEMADWAYDINAALEGAELVTKQAYSQRSDATEAQRDRAREAILFANVQCKYLLTQASFYTGLLAHVSKGAGLTVDYTAAHLLPQLIPAQLATARRFTDGIRESDLREGLLFDPRLVAYVNVLRQEKTDWDAQQRKKDSEAAATANAPASTTPAAPGSSTKLNSNSSDSTVGFDPGDTYKPPHTVLDAATAKKLSDPALCLIWVNNDCEIATLDEKYLRLNGTMDPATHDWHLKDRPKLDALLQLAEIGARHGIAFAQKTEIDTSVLAMIYEKASHQRTEGNDAAALDALRNYWRCALLGNMCWQLAHAPKAQPVELAAEPTDGKKEEASKKGDKTAKEDKPKKEEAASSAQAPAATTNTVVVVNPRDATTTTNELVTAMPAAPATNGAADNPPVAPIATNEAPVAMEQPAVTNAEAAANPPEVPIATNEVHAAMEPTAVTNASVAVNPPVAPVATETTNQIEQPAPPAAVPMVTTNAAPTPAPAPSPAPSVPASPTTAAADEFEVPVAPIAKASDYNVTVNPPATNTAPVGPIPPSTPKPVPDNADAHSLP